MIIVDTLDTLWSLDRSGKIRVYESQIRLEEDTDTYFLYSSTGLLYGKKVEAIKKAPKGKQGRNDLEQAIAVATSAWNDKRNEGYKSWTDLSLKADNLEVKISPELNMDEIFRILEIKYNTDTRWYPLPMLAEKYKAVKKLKPVYQAQPKLNGVRCIALYDVDQQTTVLVSRGGKSYNVPHIIAQLNPFMRLNQNLILDGELYCHGKPLQQISGAVRKEKDAPSWIEYHVYDEISNKIQSERNNDLRIHHSILFDQFNATSIFKVKSKVVYNADDIKFVHDECVRQGYEGLILRDPDAYYEISFRTTSLLKVKEFEDAEFEIVSSQTDSNKSVGESFCFVLRNDITEDLFLARPTGTIFDKLNWHENIKNLVGKKCVVRFQERAESGLPLQAHVRADLSKCLNIELVDRDDI